MQDHEVGTLEEADYMEEQVIEIEIERLRDFKDHPFRISADVQMKWSRNISVN